MLVDEILGSRALYRLDVICYLHLALLEQASSLLGFEIAVHREVVDAKDVRIVGQVGRAKEIVGISGRR